MTDQEIEAKFRTLTRDLLTTAQTEAILQRLWNLEHVDDIGNVMKLFRI
jgi:hypothetical protein